MSGSSITAIGKQTAIYGIGIVLSRLASFLMLPIYTRFLTPADYGILELLSMTIDVIGTLAGLGVALSVFRFATETDRQEEQQEVVSTASVAVIGIAVLTASIGLVFSPLLSRVVLGPQGRPEFFRLFFGIYFLQALETVPLLYLRLLRRSRTFVAVNLAKLIAMLTMNIVLVVFLHMSVRGVLLSNLSVSFVSASCLAVFLFKRIGWRFSTAVLRRLTSFGSPLVIVNLANFILVFSDRFFLNHYVNTSAVGIYSLAYKFAFLLSALFFQPFNMIWGPARFDVAKQADAPRTFGRVFLYLNVVLGVGGAGIAIASRDVITYMADAAFRPAYTLIPALLAAQIVYIWSDFSNVGFLLRSKTHVLAQAAVVGVVATLLLNVLLIPRFGIVGATAATIGAYMVRFLTVHTLSQRQYRIAYPWASVVRLYALLGAAVAARAALGALPLLPALAANATLFIAAVVATSQLVLTREDRDRARELVAARMPIGLFRRAAA